jgi:hypothetical protein
MKRWSSLKEFLELQRVAAEETNAQVFFVQLQEIKCLQALISRRLRELMADGLGNRRTGK